ncbi:hypothetical protein LOD99_10163 [Oopsacas minuta]|uniref:Uncharacterized protein n=1 Tax=Oopsacas minuta TaxID=111878 RepID=A0AAV7KJ37_9METZ|nr:hypothetical protein LOD99_10163 [Oopsacas minuta]
MGVTCLSELKGLQRMLHEVNPYFSYFRHAIDHMRSMNAMDIKFTILEGGIGDPRNALPLLLLRLPYCFLEMVIHKQWSTEKLFCMQDMVESKT